jgi:hypothetical protein
MLAQATSFGDDGREGVPLDGVAEEHDRLEALLEAAREALAPGREARAGECLARLAAALEAHLAHEERLHFPPIRALCPERRPALERLNAAHAGFRGGLLELRSRLEGAQLAEARRALDALAADFARHESEEEALLGALEGELARAATPAGAQSAAATSTAARSPLAAAPSAKGPTR